MEGFNDRALKGQQATGSKKCQSDKSCRHDDLLECVLLVTKACIHHHLFQRKVYPQRWFRNERLLSVHSKICRHPSVREYLNDAVSGIKDCLFRRTLKTICLSVFVPGCTPHELLCIHPVLLSPKPSENLPWIEIDRALRSLLVQIQSLQFVLPAAKEGTSFEIDIQVADVPSELNQHWTYFEDVGPLETPRLGESNRDSQPFSRMSNSLHALNRRNNPTNATDQHNVCSGSGGPNLEETRFDKGNTDTTLDRSWDPAPPSVASELHLRPLIDIIVPNQLHLRADVFFRREQSP